MDFSTRSGLMARADGPRHANGSMALYVGTFCVAASVLALQVVFTRIFSFTIWYHFSYLAMNAALLGFGSSGAVLAVRRDLLQRSGASLLCLAALLSAVLLVAFLGLSASHPLEPDEIFERPWRFAGDIALYYIGIAVPFFFAGVAVVGALSLQPGQAAKVYFADLAGAGCGAVLALGLMTCVEPPTAALMCAVLLLLGAAAFALQARRRACHTAVLVVAVLMPVVLPRLAATEFRPARSTYVGVFEGAPQAHRPVHKEWNAISRVDVFQSMDPTSNWSYPQWTYDGKSETYQMTPDKKPAFYHMLYDAHNRSDVYQFDPTGANPRVAGALEFLDHHLLKTPYLLKKAPSVLVMGSGGGIDVLNAYRNGARSIVAVDLQPAVVNMLKTKLAPWVGNLYADPRIRLVADEGRSFLRRDSGKYDLIQFTATDTWAAQNTGAYVLTESYLYTEEAIEEYLAHLTQDGMLCLLVWDAVSEQGTLRQPINSRLILQYLNVLARKGVAEPRKHLAILGKREWYGNMFTVPLLKNTPFTEPELARLRDFARQMGFQVLHDPFQATALNVLNGLIDASPSARAKLVSKAAYKIDATTDDRPFFFNIFKWSSISGLNRMTWSQPVAGQLVLVVMLVQSLLMALLTIVPPLLLRSNGKQASRLPVRAMAYFVCVGVGYMFIEIAMIQKFIVFVGYPTYAFASVVASLLIASGAGSLYVSRRPDERVLAYALAGLVATLALYQWVLPIVFETWLASGHLVRCIVAAALQAPIGVVLGMFMPIGLNRLAAFHAPWVPWAWGVNGIASVVATVMAIMAAMTWGFAVVLLVACVAYVLAAGALLGSSWESRASHREAVPQPA